MSALNRIVDAFDGTAGGNNNDDMLTALDNIADAIENGSQGGGGGGSTGGVMVVKTEFDGMGHDVFDHTWNEMFNSMANGVPVVVCAVSVDDFDAACGFVILGKPAQNEFVASLTNGTEYTCNDPDGYPAFTVPGGGEG